MATLAHLVAAGKLKKHEPDLEAGEQPNRVVYLAPCINVWLGTTLRMAGRDRGRNLDPFDQVEDILYGFATGRPMSYGYHYKPLLPVPGQKVGEGHIWELRTPDVRLIGWFPKRATFLAVCGCMKKDITKAKMYEPYIRKTIGFRDSLDLDAPKAIIGELHHHVL